MKTIAIIANNHRIESSLVSLFLSANFYVKIAVSNIEKTAQFEHLMDLDLNQNLHVSEIDQQEESAMVDFTKDCEYVLFSQHTSSSV